MNPIILQGIMNAVAKFAPAMMVFCFALPSIRAMLVPRIVALGFAASAAIYTSTNTEYKYGWLLVAVSAAALLLWSLLQWASRGEVENAGRKNRSWVNILCISIWGICCWLLIQRASESTESSQGIEAYAALALLLGVPVLLGYSLGVATETTFEVWSASQPESKSSREWFQRFSWLVGAGVLVVSAYLLLVPIDDETPAFQIILAKVFGITLATLVFAGWLLDHRIHSLRSSQRDKKSPSSSLSSLTIAAWFIALSYLVSSALPVGWPWVSG